MTIRHNYQLSKYFRKEDAYCWAPSVASPPSISSDDIWKSNRLELNPNLCLFPDCRMDCTGSTRARLGSMPAHEKQIRGSVQANPLAQGLTEKHPSFQIEKSDERPCPGRSGRCRRSPMGLRGINERKKHRPSGP